MPPQRRRPRRRSNNDGGSHEGEPRLESIDMNLPEIVLHDLSEWNERFDNLQDDRGTLNADMFGLTGVYTQNRERYRAGIDFQRHKIDRDSGIVFDTLCDIDSVIALIMGDLPISPRANFGYFMLADPSFTLTKSLDIPSISILRRPAREGFIPQAEEVQVHRIPNARFGQMGCFLILVLFPALYDPQAQKESESPNVMTDKYMALFYNLAVRVATNKVIPEELRNVWPASYDDELFRTRPLPNARDAEAHRTRLARLSCLHTERIVHGHLFNRWLREIKRLCSEVPDLAFAKGLFLLVDGKGFKDHNLSSHPVPEGPLADDGGNLYDPENPRTAAIEALFSEFFVPARFTQGEWYLDIATTVRGHIGDMDGPPVSLFVNSDLHPEIINHFSGIPLDECSRSVRRRKNGYSRDEVAHISQFANLRNTFDPPAPDNDMVKLQVYTSDKSLTYRPDAKSKAVRTSPTLCLTAWKEHFEKHFRALANAYWRAPETHSVTVRFESRVPYETYPYVHLYMRARTLRRWLYWCCNTAFWGFKWQRLNTYWNVLELICDADKARSQFSLSQLPTVGSLLILLTYMANALVNRPDDGGNFDKVHNSGCIHEIVDDRLVPVIHLGYYTIHKVLFPQIEEISFKLPRISSQRTIPPDTILYLLAATKAERTNQNALRLFRNERKRRAEESDDEDPWGIAPPGQRRRLMYPHTSNKQRVNLALPDPVADIFADILPDEELREVYSSEEDNDEVRERAPQLSGQVATLVQTYPLQIIAKLPNRKHGLGSWCRLTADERSNARSALFCDASAPRRIFTSWNNFGRDGTRWDSTLAALFPTRERHDHMLQVKTQNLPQMSVWNDWYTTLMCLSPDGEKQAIEEVKNYVSQHWRWLPFFTKNKLWVTGESPTLTGGRKVGPDPGGPWIVFNPRFED